ncbi:MAG: hypothetical protein M1834_009598 [Cirrosporium novae-zelandiae]|nr:MAG: hypothetical protein M1834_009598 [Cirrosporium novae-zelandiae]
MRRRRVKRSVVFSLPSSSSSATVSLAHTDDRDLGGDSNHDAAFNISNVHSHIGFNDANAAFKEPEPTIPNSKNNRISSQPLHVYDTIEVTARRMIQDHNDPILPPESFSFLQGGRRASSSSIMSMRTKREEEAEKPASKMGKGKEKERSPHGCEDSYFSFPPFLLLPEDSSYDSDSNSDESREESFFRDGGTTTDMDMDIDTATLETTHKCCCCEGSRLIDDRDRGSKKGKQKQGEGRCCVCVIF